MYWQRNRISIPFGCIRWIYLALFLTAIGKLCAQEKPPESVAQAPDSTQTSKSPQRDYRFEVASIRPDVLTSFKFDDPRLRPQYSPGRYREDAVTLAHLVSEAFEIKHGYQISSPAWMNSSYFTLAATVPEGASKTDIPIMLRHLLQERFGLQYHETSRKLSGYELVVVKSGLGLEKSPMPASQRPVHKGMPVEVGKDGVAHLSKDAGSGEFQIEGSAEWRGRNETMQKLAEQLGSKLNMPVMDATGLDGEYDFTLLYTPEYSLHSASAPGTAPDPPKYPILQDALREQLGLELRSTKNIPVAVTVIDAAKKMPTAN